MRSKTFSDLVFLTFLFLSLSADGQFVDRASDYGIEHRFNGTGCGSGISLVDINGDGLDDLTLGTELGASLAVYLQTDSGLELMDEISLLEVTQAIRGLNWVDYDNDGDKDLFITYGVFPLVGGMSLYNHGDDGHFSDVTWSAGLDPSNILMYYGSTWADFDNDGFLDLYICNNYAVGLSGSNRFYHNNGDGTFTDITMLLGVANQQGYSFNSVFFDADMDGDLDLFTANDRATENKLYQNLNNESFEDVSAETGMNAILNAMGLEMGDYDNDHDLDLYVTNTQGTFQGHVGNALFRNNGMNFEWLPGNPAGDHRGTFWGCNFIDYDYDRDLDLFIVNSYPTGVGYFSRYFYVNDGSGNFSDYEGDEFKQTLGRHFATAQGDLNSDGYLDIVVADGQVSFTSTQIWIGPATENHWVKVHLEGTVSNRDGIGALIEVWADGVKRIDQTTCTSSHLAQDSNSYPFGLGPHPQADTITIRWPSGIVNKLYDIPSGHRIHVVENANQETIDCMPQIEWDLTAEDGLTQDLYFSSDEELTSVTWSIDGQSVGTEDSLTYTFPSVGDYEVCLSVSNSCATQTWCQTIAVSCTTDSPEIDWEQDLLTFSAELTNSYDSAFWDLGDGTLLTADSFDHTYEESGIYTICVHVFDQCGSDSLCWDIELTCPVPLPQVVWDQDLLTLSAELTNSYDSVSWDLGDGTHLTADSFDHTYEESGVYTICVQVFDQCGTDSLCWDLELTCPLPEVDFSYEVDGFELQASSSSTGSDSLLWTLNGLAFSGDSSVTSILEPGLYELCLLALNSCGSDSLCATLDITPLSSGMNVDRSSVSIYPNPVHDELVIDFGTDRAIPLRVMVSDLSGRMLPMTFGMMSLNEQKAVLNTTQLDPGLYLLEVELTSGELINVPFLKE